MTVLKAKSVVPQFTDEQIKQGGYVTRFMSFEAAIQMFRERYQLTGDDNKHVGYRVTEQGIEIIYT